MTPPTGNAVLVPWRRLPCITDSLGTLQLLELHHLDGEATPCCCRGRLGACRAAVLLMIRPVDSLSHNLSIFFSKPLPFFLGGFSRKRPSASHAPARAGEGGPLREAPVDGVLWVEEQREELPLVSCSSVVLVVAVAEVAVLVVSRRFWPSPSLPLELLMEQTSWPSHGDTSGGGASAAESRRRHRLACLSKVQLGLMAHKSSSSSSSSWKKERL